MVMRLERLLKPRSLLAWAMRAPAQQAGPKQHPVGGGGADGYYIFIEHEIGNPAITSLQIFGAITDDGLSFPLQNPVFFGDRSIVFIGLSESFFPITKAVATQATPGDELGFGQLSALVPVVDDGDDFIAQRHLYPPGF